MTGRFDLQRAAMPLAILALTASGIAMVFLSQGYAHFILALLALNAVVGVGLNVLLGLSGQVSLGHVGFYAIGAYTSGILALNGVSFWLALPLAGLLACLIGALLALPALRATGPYLAMVTIAFAFIVHHGTVEWRELTGGQNGLMGLPPPSLGSLQFSERETAIVSILLAGLSLYAFHLLSRSAWGRAMIAVRDSDTAARSLGLNPVAVKTAAFAISALFAGLAGAVFAPLMMFVTPETFPFTQSILFLLAVMVGGAGWVLGPAVGAATTVLLPELLSSLAEYRLLFFGALLLLVLWLAPQGIVGTLAALILPKRKSPAAESKVDIGQQLSVASPSTLTVDDLCLSFGGVVAAGGVSFAAEPGRITSVIGPNGAGKTTVLNMIGGYYRPDKGSIRLGQEEVAGNPAWRVARSGIARTYQTTQLFGTLSVLENVLIALRRGRLGSPFAEMTDRHASDIAETLIAFVGFRGDPGTPCNSLAHVDRRLVEIARSLATCPRVLLLDEPAAGLMRADKSQLSALLRRITEFGIAVVLVEHDMTMVMDISDRIVVLDAGRVIADGEPAFVRNNPEVRAAYLGSDEAAALPRSVPLGKNLPVKLEAVDLKAGYGAVPVLDGLHFEVRSGELVAILGANGAGKSTTMKALSGLLRPVRGTISLEGNRIDDAPAHRIASAGLALVPEGRQVFPELSVRDNLMLGAGSRKTKDAEADLEWMLAVFPRLRERLESRAGLLSGGEQQMLALARGLMARPGILLLDEPSLGLAPAVIQDLFRTIAELRDSGITILLVDQVATQALTVADRGYVMESGRILRGDDAAALRADPALEAAYLGTTTENRRE
jgi:branched-chain amino acid transport system ATP-binding protein